MGSSLGNLGMEKSSRNWSRNRARKGNSKAFPNPKYLPKTRKGKGKGEIPVGKANPGNSLVQKRWDCPSRVLSLRVKPALKLPVGAAFFNPRRKSHSKKNPGEDPKPPQALPKAPQGKEEPGMPEKGDGSEGLERWRDIPEALEKGKDSRESSGIQQGKGSLRKSGNVGWDSQAGAAGKGDSHGISSSPGRNSEGSNPSLPAGKDLACPSKAVVYPIFSAPLASRKRPLDVLPCGFGSSPAGKGPLPSRKSRKAKELCQRSQDQLIIDAGQRHFGAVLCPSCGMLYSASNPEDEAQHLLHHHRLLEGLRYLGWKKERVVAEFWDGKIVLILPTDPKYALKKAEEVRGIVDRELGFQPGFQPGFPPGFQPGRSHTYLFVAGGRTVVGCLVAEPITQAFRVLLEPDGATMARQDSLTVPKKDSLTVPKKDSLTDPKKDFLAVPKNDSLAVPKKYSLKVPKKDSLTVPIQDSLADPTKDSLAVPEQNSLAVPKKDSLADPKKDSLTDPKKDSLAVPKKDSLAVPRNDSLTDPKKDSLTDPKKDSLAVPKKDSLAVPKNDSLTDPKKDSLTDPKKDSLAVPEQNSLADPKKDPPAFPEQDSPAFPEQHSPPFPEQDSPPFPEQHSPPFPEQDPTPFPEQDPTPFPEDPLAVPRSWCCSADPEPAVCGISRLWVLGSHRRARVASRLVDTLRSTFLFGAVLSSREIAFSDPTPHGRLFASSYCHTPQFLVYNFLSQ